MFGNKGKEQDIPESSSTQDFLQPNLVRQGGGGTERKFSLSLNEEVLYFCGIINPNLVLPKCVGFLSGDECTGKNYDQRLPFSFLSRTNLKSFWLLDDTRKYQDLQIFRLETGYEIAYHFPAPLPSGQQMTSNHFLNSTLHCVHCGSIHRPTFNRKDLVIGRKN